LKNGVEGVGVGVGTTFRGVFEASLGDRRDWQRVFSNLSNIVSENWKKLLFLNFTTTFFVEQEQPKNALGNPPPLNLETIVNCQVRAQVHTFERAHADLTITFLQLQFYKCKFASVIIQVQFYNCKFTKYNFTSFARSTTEQMPALV
jgi:hypothetical protein